MFVGRRPRTLPYLLVSVLSFVAAASCSKSSPTQPAARVALVAEVRPGFVEAGESLTIDAKTCSCATAPMIVSINDRAVGSAACGAATVFPYPAGTQSPIQIRVESPEIEPIMTSMVFAGSAAPALPGLTLSLSCRSGS